MLNLEIKFWSFQLFPIAKLNYIFILYQQIMGIRITSRWWDKIVNIKVDFVAKTRLNSKFVLVGFRFLQFFKNIGFCWVHYEIVHRFKMDRNTWMSLSLKRMGWEQKNLTPIYSYKLGNLVCTNLTSIYVHQALSWLFGL